MANFFCRSGEMTLRYISYSTAEITSLHNDFTSCVKTVPKSRRTGCYLHNVIRKFYDNKWGILFA